MLFRSLLRVSGVLLLLALLASSAPAQSTLRASGAPVYLVGDEASAFAHPVWSPDGTQLALTRPGYDGLWTVRPDGSALSQVTDDAASGFGFAWSPGGSALLARVTQTEGSQHRSAVKVYDLERGTADVLTPYRSRMTTLPRWSADGSAVLLSSAGALEVLTRPTPGAAPVREVTSASAAFVIESNKLYSVRGDAVGARAELLLDNRRIINAVASPDGARVAFEIVGGDLHVIDADGTGLTNLGRGHRPSWSPDGRWIAFMRTEDDGEQFTSSDLFAVRADGSGETVALTRTPARLEMNPSWAPDGSTIAFEDPSEGAIYLLPIAQ